MTPIDQPSEMKLIVPTFNANYFANENADGEMEEYGAPFVPVMIRRDAGVRAVLGTHDREDLTMPNVRVERRPNGWAIFLRPLGDGDPSGCVYFLDDGQNFLVREPARGTTPQIIVREWDEPVDEVDITDAAHSRWLTDDNLLNGFATEIDGIHDVLNGIRDAPTRLRLLRIARRLKAIHEAM